MLLASCLLACGRAGRPAPRSRGKKGATAVSPALQKEEAQTPNCVHKIRSFDRSFDRSFFSKTHTPAAHDASHHGPRPVDSFSFLFACFNWLAFWIQIQIDHHSFSIHSPQYNDDDDNNDDDNNPMIAPRSFPVAAARTAAAAAAVTANAAALPQQLQQQPLLLLRHHRRPQNRRYYAATKTTTSAATAGTTRQSLLSSQHRHRHHQQQRVQLRVVLPPPQQQRQQRRQQQQVAVRTTFSFAGPRKLSDVMKIDSVVKETKTSEEIRDMWLAYHDAKEDVLGLCMDGKDGELVLRRASKCKFFVQPVFRDDGTCVCALRYIAYVCVALSASNKSGVGSRRSSFSSSALFCRSIFPPSLLCFLRPPSPILLFRL